MFGFKRSLEHHPQEAPWFYSIFVGAVTLAAVVVASDKVNLVAISVGVQVMNALLLPIVLGFLFALGCRALPPAHRLRGRTKFGYLIMIIFLCCLSFYGAFAGLFSGEA